MAEPQSRTPPQGPILVTAFERFASPGKTLRPGPMGRENESEEALRAFGDHARGRCDLVVLPVDARCEVQLARALHRNPAGVVAMGEASLPGDWDTNVEVRAWDRLVVASQTIPQRAAGPSPRAPSEAFFSSPFAASLPLLPGMEREDRIGSYWCNRAYYRVLEWCLRFERPALFLHLRAGGDRGRHVAHLEHAVAAMERQVGTGAGAA